MTTPEQNRKAIQEGQKGGPGQKNQAAQGAFGAQQNQEGLDNPHPEPGKQQGGGDNSSPPQQQQGHQNPGQAGRPGGQGKQDAPQNQKR